MSLSTQDLLRGIDLAIQPTIATCNQVVDAATPKQVTGDQGSKGFVISSRDVSGVANVPDPDDRVSGVVRWKSYIWRRILEDSTIAMYAWNPNAVSDAVLLKWERIDAGKIPTQTTPDIFTGNTRFEEQHLIRTELATKLRAADNLVVDNVLEAAGTTINIKAYGAIGDGTTHYVREWVDDPDMPYSTLADVQVDYPWVTDLDADTIDYAAIQKALDVAWQIIRTNFGANPSHSTALNKSSTALAPAVSFPPGYYKVNRTLIVPPRCCLHGQGYRQCAIEHTAIGDSQWTWMEQGSGTVKECPIPSGGLLAAFLVRAGADYRLDHITDSLSHSGQTCSTDTQYSIYCYGSTYYGFTIYSDGNANTAFFIPNPSAPMFDTCVFEQIYFSGYGGDAITPSVSTQFGIVISAGVGTVNGVATEHKGTGQNITVKDCTFEYNSYCVYAEVVSNFRCYGNSISDTKSTCFTFAAFVNSCIENNGQFRSRTDVSARFFRGNLYYSSIRGNECQHLDSFFVGALGVGRIESNTLGFINSSETVSSGYIATVYPVSATAVVTPNITTIPTGRPAYVQGGGNVIANNSYNFAYAIPTSGVPFKVFGSLTSTYTTRVNIFNNTYWADLRDVVVDSANTTNITVDYSTYGKYYEVSCKDVEWPIYAPGDVSASGGGTYYMLSAFGKKYSLLQARFTNATPADKLITFNFDYFDATKAWPIGSGVAMGATLAAQHKTEFLGHEFDVSVERVSAGATTAVRATTDDGVARFIDNTTNALVSTATLTSTLANTSYASSAFRFKFVSVNGDLAIKIL